MSVIDNLTLAFIVREDPMRPLFLVSVPDPDDIVIIFWRQHAKCCLQDVLHYKPGSWEVRETRPPDTCEEGESSQRGECALCNAPVREER